MIIGINGKAGAGKDTVADMLCERDFVKVALADEIKRACSTWFGFERLQMFGPSERRKERPPSGKGPTGRKAGQHVGTEVARALYSDTWIDLVIEVAKALETGAPRITRAQWDYDCALGLTLLPGWHAPPKGVVIPDMRFENEMTAIAEAGGLLVRVKRPSAGLDGEAAAHVSETEQDAIPDSRFHYVIDNDGDLSELRAKVAAMAVRFGL